MQQTTLPSRIAVLVNTCDKFDDCWRPFFILWKKLGLKSIAHTLYLNTERKVFEDPDVRVQPLCVCTANGWSDSKPPTWSWCLAKALDAIQEEFVLYLQEDYFLTKSIDEAWLSNALEKMSRNSKIDCIHLTNIGIRRTLPGSDIPGLLRGDPRDWYYVSCQAAVWRKNTLRALIREHENAWQFERWASKRARWLEFRFYVPDLSASELPIKYVETGVIQGRWFEPVVTLFRENGIDMDFLKRGFYEGKFGKREGRWFGWNLARVRYLAKAFAVRYFLPTKSLLETIRLRCIRVK